METGFWVTGGTGMREVASWGFRPGFVWDGGGNIDRTIAMPAGSVTALEQAVSESYCTTNPRPV
jgi:hypothetical protein